MIVATFNDALLEMTFLVKILIAVLLVMMPVCLWLRTIELNMTEALIVKRIEDITGLKTKDAIRESQKSRSWAWRMMNIVLGYTPFIILGIFSTVVVVIVFLIFEG